VLEELAVGEAQTHRSARWDAASQRVCCERTLQLGALVLERSPWLDPDPTAVAAALLDAVRQMGLQELPWCSGSRQLQQRLSLAHRLLGPPWPDRSLQWLEAHLEEWLFPHLGGLRSRQDLLKLEMKQVLWGECAWSLRPELDRLLPEHLVVPSGRRVRLDYSGEEPFVAVKLQEFFGSTITPTVLDGRMPITLHLLSPAGRPAAITRDLERFWIEGYPDVRRELRGRYPKHPWPENPLQAEATGWTKARLNAARQVAAHPG
jgi:ATP-dependent helicase HrpB